MHRFNRPHIRIRQQGQTLIIALIVLGVLLILGLVFLGLVNRNILNSARSQRRSESSDLAEAGVRYAHGQLVSSPLGADWRGIPTTLLETTPGSNVTGDPDAYYLRPGYDPNNPNGSSIQGDLGGPDELGPFVRVSFPTGRALVRVRYGATDANPTKAVPGGPLRNPGAARAALIIEAVGRTGVVNAKDPTTFIATGGLPFKGFTSQAAVNGAIAALAQADGQLATSRRLVAYANIGIIDAARFETNVFNSSAPIDLGIPAGLGATAFDDAGVNGGSPVDVGQALALQLGTPGAISRLGTTNKSIPQGFGSLIVNGDLMLHGKVNTFLNRSLGDAIRVAGSITGETSTDANGNPVNSSLTITPYQYDTMTGNYAQQPVVTLTGPGAASFDSQSVNFNTAGGLVIDGSARTDQAGFASGVGILTPPSALTVDPQTKLNRYVEMTRDSGVANGSTGAQGGAFGHGMGVYVDNTSDRQEAVDAAGRATVGSQRSLFDDWLNPNSGAAGSGWQGPFYVPVGASVQLLPDGFSIQRDGSTPTWKNPDGSDSSLSTIRYRIGYGTDSLLHILDTLTATKDINGPLTTTDYQNALPFNGVLYFEGNVKVRGTIPTNVQLTLVSGATIYIDGSIVKGITGSDATPGLAQNAVLTTPSASSLMLMAKDNVAVNTTTFFGPTANQAPESTDDQTGTTNISSVRLRAGAGAGTSQIDLLTQLVLDPSAGTNPSQWSPYALTYRSYDRTAAIPTLMLVGQKMDPNASASFEALDVNYGAATSAYAFSAVDPDGLITNAATAYASATPPAAGATIAIYGLGAEPWQKDRYELRSFPLIGVGASFSGTTITQPAPYGYSMFAGDNTVTFRPGSVQGVGGGDTFLGRAAIMPSDVKIEASIFAEQGSFFVIPGPWFNPDVNDTHLAYAARVGAIGRVQADRERLENHGASPDVPFYGEPLDVRINVVGSVAENLPPPASVQAEWIRKWGWIPNRLAARTDGSGNEIGIPLQHVQSAGIDPTSKFDLVSNIVIQYDPVLATGRLNDISNQTPVRVDPFGRPLPPMPRLPVSPRLAYFGEL